jgi:hypothetical protein
MTLHVFFIIYFTEINIIGVEMGAIAGKCCGENSIFSGSKSDKIKEDH